MDYRVTTKDMKQVSFGEGIVTNLLNGGEHGLSTISVMLSELQPGSGPRMHRHVYEEAFVVHAGRGSFTIAGTTVVAGPGEVVVIPGGLAHRFKNVGDDTLRVTAIHGTGNVSIEWLE